MNKTVVVLGMHRSGTSMIAGILYFLGVNMGEKLIGRMASNPLGHFEDEEFVKLNDRILKLAGGSWHNPPERESILKQQEVFDQDIKSVTARLSCGIGGWKDPRTSLTIELFLPYLANPFFIIIQRAPGAVARSLKKRDNFNLEKSISLRLSYENRIKNFFTRYPELPYLDLNYNAITGQPRLWLNIIIKFLSLSPEPVMIQRAFNFISPRRKG